MDPYHFLVGEFRNNSPFIPAAASAQLFAWFAHIGEPVERYGSKRGKVVKFSQRNYEKMLYAPETDSIELFSRRIVPPDDETCEVTNCDALAVHDPAVSLLLAIRASKLPLQQLFNASASIPGLFEHCEYVYGYSETLGYGTGYARGYRQLDEAHPMTFGPCPANNWAAIRRRGLQDAHLRDVYPINGFTQARLDALPPERRQALRDAMQAYGRCEEHAGLTFWYLQAEELEAARAALNAHAMLGAYINN